MCDLFPIAFSPSVQMIFFIRFPTLFRGSSASVCIFSVIIYNAQPKKRGGD